MPARKKHSLNHNKAPEDRKYRIHREHRSRKAQRGLGGSKRIERLIRLGVYYKEPRVCYTTDITSMSVFQDKKLPCTDCKQDFTLSAGEQDFFNTKGLQEPKRCKLCRKKKTAEMKAKKEQGATY